MASSAAVPVMTLLVAMVTTVYSGEITWDKDVLDVTQGDDVSITCTVTDFDMFGVMNTALQQQGDNKVEHILTSNEDLKPFFRKTGRYESKFTTEGSTGRVTITYKGVRGEDSGSISCYTLDNPSVKATVQLSVQVPLKSVHLLALENGQQRDITPGETFDMTEGLEMGITCLITLDGSDVSPKVVITMSEEDVTSQFTRTETQTPVSMSSDSLPNIGNEIRYTYVTLEPNKDFNRKEMKCTVTGKSAPDDVHSLNLFINIFYIPVVTCKTVEYFAQVGRSTSVSCDVRSNPEANLSYVFGGQDREMTLQEHPQHEQYRTEVKTISEDHKEIHINIHEVHPTHFGRYFIRAENEYGTGHTEFLLHKGATEVDIQPEPPMLLPSSHQVEPPVEAATDNKPMYMTPSQPTPKPQNNIVIVEEPQASTNNLGVTTTQSVVHSSVLIGLVISYIITHFTT